MKESLEKRKKRITGEIGKQRVACKPVGHIEPGKQGRDTENPIDSTFAAVFNSGSLRTNRK
jgi:hypothetical protein